MVVKDLQNMFWLQIYALEILFSIQIATLFVFVISVFRKRSIKTCIDVELSKNYFIWLKLKGTESVKWI